MDIIGNILSIIPITFVALFLIASIWHLNTRGECVETLPFDYGTYCAAWERDQ